MLSGMSRQIAVKLPEALLDEVDDLVRSGSVESRADAVRRGLGLLLRSTEP
jgi:Arc/MetJ-type ribon-helix-helix transcriptional regulator